jgi:hypothetical protein
MDFDDILRLNHLIAVGRGLRLRIESGRRLGDRHGNESAGLFPAGEHAAAAGIATHAVEAPPTFSLPLPRRSR